MTEKRRRVTAAELLQRLNADPTFVARRQQAERERDAKDAEWTKAERPLVKALRDVGVKVDSAWDLVELETPYPAAVPILLEHLRRPYPDRVREGIARALGVPEARNAWDALVEAYRGETGEDTKDGLAAALAAIFSDETLDDVISLVRDPRNGESRVILVSALAKSKQPTARLALQNLATDPTLGEEARAHLRQHGSQSPSENARQKKRSVAPPKGLREASANLDLEVVEPLLERISKTVSGFERAQVAEVVQAANRLATDGENELAFPVTYEGEACPMRIRIIKDDVDSISLYFFTPARLARVIADVLDDFR